MNKPIIYRYGVWIAFGIAFSATAQLSKVNLLMSGVLTVGMGFVFVCSAILPPQ